MYFKKAQNSTEFIIIFVFVFVIISIIMGITGYYSISYKNEENKKEVDEFAQSIINEFILLEEAEDGYSRELIIEAYEQDRFNITFDLPYLILQDLQYNEDGSIVYTYNLPTNYSITAFENSITGDYHIILTKLSDCYLSERLNIYSENCNFNNFYGSGLFDIKWYNSSSCETGYEKMLGLSSDSFSHAQISSLGTYNWSLCVGHMLYDVSISCSGTYETILFLGDENNSHIWSDTASAYPFLIYNWQEICLSSSDPSVGGVSVIYSDLPQTNHTCLASYVGNHTYGGATIGPCSPGLESIWVDFEG